MLSALSLSCHIGLCNPEIAEDAKSSLGEEKAAAPESKKVILFLGLAGVSQQDPAFGDVNYTFLQFKKKMNSRYPGRIVRGILTDNQASLAEDLNKILQKGELISHLEIDTHGTSNDTDAMFMCGTSPILFNSSKDPSMRPAEFQPIRGRFTSDAVVSTSACNILKGAETQAQLKLAAIQHGLGLSSGFIYANSSLGLARIDRIQPFWKQKTFPGIALGLYSQLPWIYPAARLFGMLYSLKKGRPIITPEAASTLLTPMTKTFLSRLGQNDRWRGCADGLFYGWFLGQFAPTPAYYLHFNRGYRAQFNDAQMISFNEDTYFSFRRNYFRGEKDKPYNLLEFP